MPGLPSALTPALTASAQVFAALPQMEFEAPEIAK
jgi:hypothetical protein